ncbi:MAG: hypothetical protein R2705_14325 [Ilumatobacteraceae bacterium]
MSVHLLADAAGWRPSTVELPDLANAVVAVSRSIEAGTHPMELREVVGVSGVCRQVAPQPTIQLDGLAVPHTSSPIPTDSARGAS